MANGEGSRGGKIIGHTKSGLPIYEGHHQTQVKSMASAADHAAKVDRGKPISSSDIAQGQETYRAEYYSDHTVDISRKSEGFKLKSTYAIEGDELVSPSKRKK